MNHKNLSALPSHPQHQYRVRTVFITIIIICFFWFPRWRPVLFDQADYWLTEWLIDWLIPVEGVWGYRSGTFWRRSEPLWRSPSVCCDPLNPAHTAESDPPPGPPAGGGHESKSVHVQEGNLNWFSSSIINSCMCEAADLPGGRCVVTWYSVTDWEAVSSW